MPNNAQSSMPNNSQSHTRIPASGNACFGFYGAPFRDLLAVHSPGHATGRTQQAEHAYKFSKMVNNTARGNGQLV
jgi:hypothetical protein